MDSPKVIIFIVSKYTNSYFSKHAAKHKFPDHLAAVGECICYS